jgi:hypothetical protein
MSHKKSSSVSELIKNVLKIDPYTNREILGRLIRAENPEYKTPSGRRKLDRALSKVFTDESRIKRNLELAVFALEQAEQSKLPLGWTVREMDKTNEAYGRSRLGSIIRAKEMLQVLIKVLEQKKQPMF